MYKPKHYYLALSIYFPLSPHSEFDNIIALILLFNNDLFILKTMIYGIKQQ